jgi:hypothetical protein
MMLLHHLALEDHGLPPTVTNFTLAPAAVLDMQVEVKRRSSRAFGLLQSLSPTRRPQLCSGFPSSRFGA